MAHLDSSPQTAFFIHGPRPLTRLVIFGLLSIGLMVLDSRMHYLTEIRQGFAALLRPLEAIAGAPLAAAHYVGGYLSTQTRLVEENRALRHDALQHALDLQRFRTLQQENARLRALLGAAQASTHTVRLGEIAHTGRDPFARRVVLNVGARQQIAPGQAVIDHDGVIGQVTRVFPFTSEVTLITSKDLAIPVQVERTGMRAIAFGLERTHQLNLPYLPVNVNIRPNDLLVTSGIDGVYPSGLPVARVATVERDPHSTFARIVCLPVARISTHRQVLIVELKPHTASGAVIAPAAVPATPPASRPATPPVTPDAPRHP